MGSVCGSHACVCVFLAVTGDAGPVTVVGGEGGVKGADVGKGSRDKHPLISAPAPIADSPPPLSSHISGPPS